MLKYATAFITPENELITMNYDKVEEFCKQECNKPENIDKFSTFKKDYTYYHPYFDFVMFELNYQMINPLFKSGTALVNVNQELYLTEIDRFNYNEIRNKLNNRNPNEIPIMTKCSTKEMNIRKQSSEHVDHCMIDPNLIGQMSRNSHEVTSNTILNQLLITSTKVMKDFYNFYHEEDCIENGMSINYLLNSLGFLRAAPIKDYPILMLVNGGLSEEQNQFVTSCEEMGYNIYRLGENKETMTNEFKEIVTPIKK